jgi:ribosomal protein S8
MSMGSSPMFPIITTNYTFSYAINAVNLAASHRDLKYKILCTRKVLRFIKIFRHINYITRFAIIKQNNQLYVAISPFYFRGQKPFKSFRLVSKPSRAYYVSLEALRLLNKRSGGTIYLISTSHGIVTSLEAVKKKISGYLVGFFYY